MIVHEQTDAKNRINLIDSLTGEWIKLPFAAMRDVGPAAQTLGGLMKVTKRETFVSISTIAEKSRLPVRTAAKHLATLQRHGWINNRGRERTRAGRPRRTCTIVVTSRAKLAQQDYGVLPWWACSRNRHLAWSDKAVLSVVMARLMSLRSAVVEEELDSDDFWGSIENLGGCDRFQFSLDELQHKTGLSRPSIIGAKHALHRRGIIEWIANQRRNGADDTDILEPSRSFTVTIKPAGEGRCYVQF